MGIAVWPNLFIVGAAKAGTTSLYHYLEQHPDVYMSRMKEPHFFSRIEPDPKLSSFFPRITDEAAYLALFAPGSGASVRGEASTSYLPHPDVPAMIKRHSPDAKIVIMIRDPVERAYSHYWNDVREGIERRSFETALAHELAAPVGRWGASSLYVDCGFYAERIERYLSVFGDDLLVLFFEEFVADLPGHIERTLAFVGVDPRRGEDTKLEVHNPFALPRNAVSRNVLGSGATRAVSRLLLPRSLRRYGRSVLLRSAQKPPMDPSIRLRLKDLYREDVERLSSVLGRRAPWPTFEQRAA